MICYTIPRFLVNDYRAHLSLINYGNVQFNAFSENKYLYTASGRAASAIIENIINLTLTSLNQMFLYQMALIV